MANIVGQTIGQYQITEKIGSGGMADVYKAYQPTLDRYVAVKVLPEYYVRDETFLARFQHEARAIAKLTHPNILPIHDFGQEGDLTYLVMHYVGGGTLKDVMGQPMSPIETADYIDQIAAALDHAHQRGILHRDIKPGNILLEDGKRVLLADFGLAKMTQHTRSLTASGVGVGTPAYMSPEQGRGAAVDARTDVYALGVILYEMVTGQVPFMADTPMAIIIQHMTAPLPLPRSIVPELSKDVEKVILKALAKSPNDRYNQAGQLAKALRQAIVEEATLLGLTNLNIYQTPQIVETETTPQIPQPISAVIVKPRLDIITITKPFQMELVCVPAGEFLMGSNPAQDGKARHDELPQHAVQLPKFYIGKYLVTNIQYVTFLRSTNYQADKRWQGNSFPVGDHNYPAIFISWHDAVAFCHWFSDESGYAIRLPTEAEWEKTARGAKGQIYPWGNEWAASHLNFGKSTRKFGSLLKARVGTTAVGHYSPEGDSPYGAADMLGNIWEWCSTIWVEKTYPFQVQNEWQDEYLKQKDVLRVLRGGSWHVSQGVSRCAFRFRGDPAHAGGIKGCRVAISTDV